MNARQAAVALAAAALLLGGCGGEKDDDEVAAPTPTVTCGDSASAAKLPAAFPTDLPLPPGTVLTSAKDDGKSITAIGRMPGTIKGTATFFSDRLPKAGYDLGEGDSEDFEVESHFDGNGFAGYYKARTIGGCDGTLTLALVLTRE